MMRKKLSLVLGFLLVLGLASFAYADEEPSFYLGIKPAGMGGAYCAIANDENALFFNPAGLSEIKSSRWVVVNPAFKIGEGMNTLKDLADELDDANTTQARSEVIGRFIPLNVLVGTNLFPYYITPDFGFGVLGEGNVRVEVLNPVSPRIEISGYVDTNIVGSYCRRINPKLSVGATLKSISRSRVLPVVDEPQGIDSRDPNDPERNVVVITQSDLLNYDKDDFEADDFYDTQTGSGMGLDIGTLYKLNKKTTLGLTLQDIGGTSLEWDSDVKSRIPGRARLGVAYKADLPKALAAIKAKDVTLALDFADLGTGGSFYKKIHFGGEAIVLRKISLRFGVNQGYGTFGLGYRLGFLQLDWAYFSEERGEHVGQQQDKSQMMKVSLRF